MGTGLRSGMVWIGLAASLAACYPDQDPGVVRLSLALSELGVQQQALDTWISWETGERAEPYEMNTTDQNFFLALGLSSEDPQTELALAGGLVDGSDGHLLIDLQIGDCRDCRLGLVLFAEAQGLKTYAGASGLFDVPLPAGQDSVVMDAELAETGSLVIETDANAVGPPRMAAVDDEANVRLPPMAGAVVGERARGSLESMPVGRQLIVQVERPDGWESIGSVALSQAGQTITVSD